MKYLSCFLLLAALLCCTACQSERVSDEPGAQEAPLQGVPSYEVHKRNPYFKGGEQGHIFLWGGWVLPPDSLAKVAILIAKHEKLERASYYVSEEGYKANMSASYQARHPDALRNYFLGTVEDGRFIKPIF